MTVNYKFLTVFACINPFIMNVSLNTVLQNVTMNFNKTNIHENINL